jgi:hypothetical protein
MFRGGVVILAVALMAAGSPWRVHAADLIRRAPLDSTRRAALVTLLDAVDAAQHSDRKDEPPNIAAEPFNWQRHILKSGDHTAYVPFRLALTGGARAMKSALIYVRAVSRLDGNQNDQARSWIREWLLRGGDPLPVRQETIAIGPGEMPVGGPATSSSRRGTQAPAEASAILSLQQREFERQKAADEAARKKTEERASDPNAYAFEEYYLADVKSATIERALSLPPGEFDVYIALLDIERSRTMQPSILKRTVTVPDLWNDRLGLSSLMLVSGVNTLKAPLSPQQQVARPYAFGHAEVIPVRTATFSSSDVLSVVFQLFNYGAPDADVSVEYNFFQHVDGSRRLFNRTPIQELTDRDLRTVSPWETQAFASQAVSLRTFPRGRYELEVTARDRRTRATATQSVTFTIE